MATRCSGLNGLTSQPVAPAALPSAFLSAADKKSEGKAAGATGWLVKPFNPEQLVATVQKVLG